MTGVGDEKMAINGISYPDGKNCSNLYLQFKIMLSLYIFHQSLNNAVFNQSAHMAVQRSSTPVTNFTSLSAMHYYHCITHTLPGV
jgi:hypothetical protein